MIYGGIITLLLGVLAYIQYLRNLLQKHQLENATLKTQAKNAEWDNQINQSKAKVTEEEKDFKDAEDNFKSKYGDGSNKPSTS